MNVPDEIFKAYDIRGVADIQLNADIANAIGKAFTRVVSPTTVIIGRDGRVSSPEYKQAVVDGLTEVGVNVIDVGMVSTDMYYYACATKKLPGIMITASHNPKEYNGFKMVRQIPYLLSGDDGIQEMKVLIQNDDLPEVAEKAGTVTEWNIMDGFIEKLLSLVDTTSFKPMRVLIDTSNGMVGPSLIELFKHLPQIEMTPMYFEVDGTFPNHGGDPLQEENRRELQERVAAEGFDLGFTFDPDGDRFFCIDSTGRFVSGDFLTALLGEYFLKANPGSTIVYDIRASRAVRDLVERAGGTALYNRVGHAFIKKRMVDESAVFGGEVTGHYYFSDFYYCDSGVAPMLYLMDLLTKSDKTLAQMIDELEKKYFISGEINTKGVDSQAVFAELEEVYGSEANQVLHVDGVSIIFDDWHFNVRASNTEPLVRLNLEATNKQLMEEKRDEVLALIRKDRN
jgi:phosphomannomutase